MFPMPAFISYFHITFFQHNWFDEDEIIHIESLTAQSDRPVLLPFNKDTLCTLLPSTYGDLVGWESYCG